MLPAETSVNVTVKICVLVVKFSRFFFSAGGPLQCKVLFPFQVYLMLAAHLLIEVSSCSHLFHRLRFTLLVTRRDLPLNDPIQKREGRAVCVIQRGRLCDQLVV